MLTGAVACGDDASTGTTDGGNESGAGGTSGSGGSEPREDGGDPSNPKPDASEPEPDAGPDSGEPPEPNAGEPEPDAGEPEPDAGEPLTLGGLTVSVDPEDHDLDLFGVPGHRFWLEVSEEQLVALNQGDSGGGGDNGDIYTPGQSTSSAHYADHVLVENAENHEVADYGKVELSLVGESTFRNWDENRIPNIRIDTNEFNKDTRIGTYEHMRLNNGLVGSIFREALAHRIYRALDYPALQSSHAFLGSSVWGDDVWVPMVFMEMYKKRFCKDNQDLIGGSCDNMWEFFGDIGSYDQGPGGGDTIPREWCQVADCDNTRLTEVRGVLAETPRGEGFKDALNDYIDWDRFHEFQCLNWIMWVGDDPIHNSNNNLIIERDNDHKLVWAPYSVDISAGQDWYTNVPLPGGGSIAGGCQQDRECWADTIATCEDVIIRFDELNPEEMVDDLVTTLTDLGMMRYGDEDRAEELREWYVWRQTVLTEELEVYRYLPDEYGNCPDGMIQCGDGGCGTEEACESRVCQVGLEPCEASNQCYDPDYDYCPVCTEEEPYYCHHNGSCTASEQACQDACGGGFYVWCEYHDRCLPYFQCPYVDSDAGVAGDGGGGVGGVGGAGGFAGFGMGGFPGGGMVPVGGMGAFIDEGP